MVIHDCIYTYMYIYIYICIYIYIYTVIYILWSILCIHDIIWSCVDIQIIHHSCNSSYIWCKFMIHMHYTNARCTHLLVNLSPYNIMCIMYWLWKIMRIMNLYNICGCQRKFTLLIYYSHVNLRPYNMMCLLIEYEISCASWISIIFEGVLKRIYIPDVLFVYQFETIQYHACNVLTIPRKEHKARIDWGHLKICLKYADFPARSINISWSLQLAALCAPSVEISCASCICMMYGCVEQM